MNTNANTATLATLINDSTRCARFVSVVTTLKGASRLAPGEKRGGLKIRVGNDTVRDTFVAGASYMNLKAKDAAILDALTGADLDAMAGAAHSAWSGRGAKATQVTVTRADFDLALAEMIVSTDKTLAGTNTSTTDAVYESLTVDGETIPGYRVYVGPTDPTATPAAAPGTIYVQGLRVGRKVIEAAEFAKPASKSAAKTVAKRVITRLLPSRRYVSYCLEAGTDFILNLGSDAVTASDAAGITVDPTAVTEALALALAA
jgi:hypothetical protein